MLRLRLTTDAQARWKNGRPDQSTTGVASANWIQADRRGGSRACISNRCAPIAITKSGTVKIAPITNRRRKSTYSGFGSGSTETVVGSSAIPQIGQLPELGRAPVCTPVPNAQLVCRHLLEKKNKQHNHQK